MKMYDMPELECKAFGVYEEGKRFVYGKNIEQALPIASISKLFLDAAVGFDKERGHETVILGKDHFTPVRGKQVNSVLEFGTVLSMTDLRKITLVGSENCAARRLGETNADRFIYNFSDSMYALKRKLPINDTVIVEPSGLSPSNVSSVRDITMLLCQTKDLEEFVVPSVTVKFKQYRDGILSGTKQHTWQHTASDMITDLQTFRRLKILAIKSGYTSEAGHCVTTRISYLGRRFVITLLGCKNKTKRFLALHSIVERITQDIDKILQSRESVFALCIKDTAGNFSLPILTAKDVYWLDAQVDLLMNEIESEDPLESIKTSPRLDFHVRDAFSESHADLLKVACGFTFIEVPLLTTNNTQSV